MRRIRWWIALAWDRIFPLSCWAETAMWAMGYEGARLLRDSERGEHGGYCPDSAEETCGLGCWCGKFKAKGHDHAR